MHGAKPVALTVAFVSLICLAGCETVDPHEAELRRISARVDSFAVTLTSVVSTLERTGARADAGMPDTLTVGTNGAAAIGDVDAPVTIVEFTDYQCPFCARHASQTFPALARDFVSKGLVRYVIRDLPLPIHALAEPAAVLGRCVAEQDPIAFWRFHDTVFQAQQDLTEERLERIAAAVGVEPDELGRCQRSPRVRDAVRADAAEAAALGLQATPAFVIGATRTDGRLSGTVIRGAYPIARFVQAITEARGSRR